MKYDYDEDFAVTSVKKGGGGRKSGGEKKKGDKKVMHQHVIHLNTCENNWHNWRNN